MKSPFQVDENNAIDDTPIKKKEGRRKKKAITQPAKNFKIWTEYAEGGIFWMIDWNQQIK